MLIEPLRIPGAFIIKQEPFRDERGAFARVFCRREFAAAGLDGDIAQVNWSANAKKGTLRGLHGQRAEFAEDKLVACSRGAIFDVCVDARQDSPTYSRWVGETLSADNGVALYIPKGCAHGYLTLTDDAWVLYFVTQFYAPDAEVGYRFDDPRFGVRWPLAPPYIMSEKDQRWELL